MYVLIKKKLLNCMDKQKKKMNKDIRKQSTKTRGITECILITAQEHRKPTKKRT